jgi:hypothetical protein
MAHNIRDYLVSGLVQRLVSETGLCFQRRRLDLPNETIRVDNCHQTLPLRTETDPVSQTVQNPGHLEDMRSFTTIRSSSEYTFLNLRCI